MSKVRFQMFIDEGQKRYLEEVQRELNVPVAEIIRKAIDQFLAGARKGRKHAPVDKITSDLLSVTGVCEGGPADLADSHDAYLYGVKKK